MRHIKSAERYCDELQYSDATDATQLRIEYHVIKGMKARLMFKQGEDMDQTDRVKNDSLAGIDEGLKLLKVIDEDRFNRICANVRGWRDRLARSGI